MADHDSQATYQPFIPKHLISEEDMKFIEAFGVSCELDGDDGYYFFEENYCTTAYLKDSEGNEVAHTEEDLLARFQEIVRRSKG